MKKVVFNAENAIVGRLGSLVAKELLKGNEVIVINSEKALVSGDKNLIVQKITQNRRRGGTSLKGPKISKLPDRLLKRMMRGMLPWNIQKGRDAYKRLKCYTSRQSEGIQVTKEVEYKKPNKFIAISEISKLI